MTDNTEKSQPMEPRAPLLAGVGAALERAAQKARENARKNNVPLVFSKNGKVVEETLEHKHPTC